MAEHETIAFLCHPYHRGGVTRWMADAAMAATMVGCNVYFVTVAPVREFFSGRGRNTMLSLLQDAPAGLNIVSCPVDHRFEFGTPEYRAGIYAGLVDTYVPRGAAIILSDDSAVWGASAYLGNDYHFVGVIHGQDDTYFYNASRYAGFIGACVCVSHDLEEKIKAQCPQVPPASIHVIPCGINLPPFAPVDSGNSTLQLIYIGRVDEPVKQAGDLVLLAELMHKNKIDFHLTVAGNSPASAARFAEKFKALGIEHLATFKGWLSVTEVQHLLNRSDILLLTSNFEGMPLAMMEALASGCGFTGTRVGGIGDYEHHPLAADCISVYTVGDIVDGVDKIKKIAAIPKDRRRSAARALAEQEFSMSVCLSDYMQVIRSMPTLPVQKQPKPSFTHRLYSSGLAQIRYLKMKMLKK